MGIILEKLNVPSRVLHNPSWDTMMKKLEKNYDLDNCSIHTTTSYQEAKHEYENNKPMVLLYVREHSSNLIVSTYCWKEWNTLTIDDINPNAFIEAYIFDLVPLNIQKIQDREKSKEGMVVRKDHADYNTKLDKSGYEIDIDKYIKKLNDTKRISGTFEKQLLALYDEYEKAIDLFTNTYKTSLRNKLSGIMNKYISSSEIRTIHGDMLTGLDEIIGMYSNYVKDRKIYSKIMAEEPDNKQAVKNITNTITRDEKEIVSTINELKKKLEYITQEKLANISTSGNTNIEESIYSKSVFKKVFEAVSGPKLFKEMEVDGYKCKVYTKPFTKASLAKFCDDSWQVPSKFNQFDYLIAIHKDGKIKSCLISLTGKDNLTADYGDFDTICKIAYEIYKYGDDFFNITWMRESEKLGFITNKEELLKALCSYRIISRIDTDIKINGLDEDIVVNTIKQWTDVDYDYKLDNVIDLFEYNDVLTKNVVSRLQNELSKVKYISFLKQLLYNDSKKRDISKWLYLLNPFENKIVLERLNKNNGSVYDTLVVKYYTNRDSRLITDIIPTEYITQYIRGNIDVLKPNYVKYLLQQYPNLPKDCKKKLYSKLDKDEIGDYHYQERPYEIDFSQLDLNRNYYEILNSYDLLLKLLNSNVKIPDYMVNAISKIVNFREEPELKTAFKKRFGK